MGNVTNTTKVAAGSLSQNNSRHRGVFDFPSHSIENGHKRAKGSADRAVMWSCGVDSCTASHHPMALVVVCVEQVISQCIVCVCALRPVLYACVSSTADSLSTFRVAAARFRVEFAYVRHTRLSMACRFLQKRPSLAGVVNPRSLWGFATKGDHF